MSGKEWITILDLMYEEMMVIGDISSSDVNVEFGLARHPNDDTVEILSEYTEYDNELINKELRALSAAGLVDNKGEERTYGLTERGVKVAHERQQNRQYHGTQKILSYLTGILAVSAIGQFIVGLAYFQSIPWIQPILVMVYVVILFVVLLLIRNRYKIQ